MGPSAYPVGLLQLSTLCLQCTLCTLRLCHLLADACSLLVQLGRGALRFSVRSLVRYLAGNGLTHRHTLHATRAASCSCRTACADAASFSSRAASDSTACTCAEVRMQVVRW